MTFFKLDWLNLTAAILAWRRCGQIQWFLQQPEKIPTIETAEVKN